MKLVSCCVGFLLCALPRPALAQDPSKSGVVLESPAPPLSPPGVSPAPRSTDAALTQPPPAVPALGPQRRVWYGSQTLISDAVSLSVTVIGLRLLVSGAGEPDYGVPASPWFTVGEGLLLIGPVGYVVAPIAIHANHDRVGAAFGSAGLRLLLPFLGAEIGYRASCRSGTCDSAGTSEIVGLIAGVVGASVADASLLAWENAKPAPPVAARSSFGLAPLLSADRKPAGLRVFGTF